MPISKIFEQKDNALKNQYTWTGQFISKNYTCIQFLSIR